jgi:alpha-1,2-mannosyltransferase
MDDLKDTVKRQFGVNLSAAIEIIPLQHVENLSQARWPRFTMLCQALASVAVAWSGLRQAVPEVQHPAVCEEAPVFL